MADGSHYFAVLLNLVEVLVNGLCTATTVVLPELCTLHEGLLLGAIPFDTKEQRKLEREGWVERREGRREEGKGKK